jgi:hypothetical protein
VDAKTVPDRQWVGVESPRWNRSGLRVEPFASQWGAPYGARQVRIPSGRSVEIALPGTDFSVAYTDQRDGGTLRVEIDGRDALRAPTNVPFTTAAGERLSMENRKGIRGLAYGLHVLRITADAGPVALLGVFSYDTRANRAGERVLRGTAYPGETIAFTQPFQARPLVICTGGLQARAADITPTGVRFRGSGPGSYEIVGE